MELDELLELLCQGKITSEQMKEEIIKKDAYSGEEVAKALYLVVDNQKKLEERISNLENKSNSKNLDEWKAEMKAIIDDVLNNPESDYNKNQEKRKAEWDKNVDKIIESLPDTSTAKKTAEFKNLQNITSKYIGLEEDDIQIICDKISDLMSNQQHAEAYQLACKYKNTIGVPKNHAEFNFLLKHYTHDDFKPEPDKKLAQNIYRACLTYIKNLPETSRAVGLGMLAHFCNINHITKDPLILEYFKKKIDNDTIEIENVKKIQDTTKRLKELKLRYSIRSALYNYFGDFVAAEKDQQEIKKIEQELFKQI